MKNNMGTADKAIRSIVAIVAVVLYALEIVTGTWGYVMLAVAAIFFLTSFMSFCPLYVPFGLNTGKK
ncbi:MAG: YgaP family membrane protein [Bacteroidota bacterium]